MLLDVTLFYILLYQIKKCHTMGDIKIREKCFSDHEQVVVLLIKYLCLF